MVESTQNLAAIEVLGKFTVGFIVAMMAVLPGFLAWLKTCEIKQAVQELHVIVNSRLDRLIAATSALARSEGIAEGISEAKAKDEASDNAQVTEP